MARKTITRVCTKTGESFTGTWDQAKGEGSILESFYRDKSQKDGLSPWCKAAERSYNKAYRSGLKDAEAPRKADIEEDQAMAAFEQAMTPERVARKRGTQNTNEKATQKAASKKRTQTRKRQRATKKAQVTATA